MMYRSFWTNDMSLLLTRRRKAALWNQRWELDQKWHADHDANPPGGFGTKNEGAFR
jgi:hypothetical protein